MDRGYINEASNPNCLKPAIKVGASDIACHNKTSGEAHQTQSNLLYIADFAKYHQTVTPPS